MSTDNGTGGDNGEQGNVPDNVDNAKPGSQEQQLDDGAAKGSAAAVEAVLAGLDTDNREWLTKQGYDLSTPDGLGKLAKQVYAQERLLGNAIRIPGKDATPEQREEFLNKLGRPPTADGYEFVPPKDLPEELPYDGERASAFKTFAHSIGLTAQQAASVHDWAAGNAVKDFQNIEAQRAAQTEQQAKAATEALVKLWGPLDGQTARANLEFADRFLMEAGGAEVKQELEAKGLIGPDKVILSPAIAQLFAAAGAALYKEDGKLKGDPDKLNNPFADGASNNVTEQMRIAKSDPEAAKSLIFAAGKTPEDFGLKL